MSSRIPPPPEPASDEDLIAFMRWLRKRPRRKGPSLRFDDPVWRDLVPPEFRDKLPGITLRIIMDVMKRPAPPGLSEPVRGAPSTRRTGSRSRRSKKPAGKSAARNPAAKRRRRRAG
jgi:hypothetical protein